MRSLMIEPYGENIFLNLAEFKFLASSIRKNHQVQMDANRNRLPNLTEVRQVLREVDGTTQQDQLSDLKPTVSPQHSDIPAVAMGDEVQACIVVCADPIC